MSTHKKTLKEIVAEEYIKCSKDPIYFMRKYCMIQHPTRGKINFHLYPFQEKTLNEFKNNRFNIVLKSRQTGISTLSAGYSLWKMIFNSDFNVLVIATKQEVAKNLVTKVRVMHELLPSWLKGGHLEDNKLSLRLKNGSQIKAISSSPDAGRSEALSLLIFDEAAFIDDIDEIWASAQSTLSTGGSCVALSCVTSDTFVFTDKGIQQVEDFVPSNEFGDYEIDTYNIMGVGKLRSGKLFHTNGKVKTKKIKTKFSELEGSYNHKLWACKGGEYNWYRLDELNVGDWVSIQYGMNIWGNDDDVSEFNPTISKNHKNIFNINQITPDIAYLIGLYIAEGSSYLSYNSIGNLIGGNITLTCGDDITDAISKCGLSYSCTDGLHYTISSKTFIEFLQYIGFDLSKTASEKIIPKRLLKMSSKNISALLSGIFDGDGFVGTKTGKVGIGLSSELLINQIRIILNNFGILSSKYIVSKDLMNSYNYFDNKFNYNSYRLELNSENSIKFHELIGFRFNRKSITSLIFENIDLTNSKSNNVIPYSLDMCHYMFDVYGKGNWTWNRYHNLNISNIINKKNRYKTEHISSNNVRNMYDVVHHLLSEDIQEKYNRILLENTQWVEITEIIDSENYTYDFSLPNDDTDYWDHSVIYNGIIGHQTPNGVGNWFHKTWVGAEEGSNPFVPISLHWTVHPERDQAWRDEQTKLLGPKIAAQECDVDFISSGDTVIDPETLMFYKETYCKEPIEKGYIDSNLWKWEYVDYNKSYIVVADVARGDGSDYSTAHVIDIDSVTQVAEYRGKLETKDFGNFLVSLATEYNDALLVIENANIGWAVIQQVIDRGYKNLFYMSKDLRYVDVEHQLTNRYRAEERGLVAGFSTTSKTRPLIISKLDDYFREKAVVVRSIRLIDELFTFIFINGRAEAMRGYNDDLVMAFGIALWVRDTALRLRQQGINLTKQALGGISTNVAGFDGVYGGGHSDDNPWKMRVGDDFEDLSKWI